MPFGGIVDGFDDIALRLQNVVHLLRLPARDADIVFALNGEQRRLGVFNIGQWRRTVIACRIFLGRAHQAAQIRLQDLVHVAVHGTPVDNAEPLHTGGKLIRCFADRHQCHKAAVGSAENTDAFWVDITTFDQEILGRNGILQITAAQIVIIGGLEGLAIACRSPEIGCNDDITPTGECRSNIIEIVLRLAGWPTMGKHNGRVAAVTL